jgi:hypothetical protein
MVSAVFHSPREASEALAQDKAGAPALTPTLSRRAAEGWGEGC